MSFISCRAYGDEVDDQSLPWDPIWAYVLDEGDEQSTKRRSTTVKRDTSVEPVILPEPQELTRRHSFWHRREELLQQKKDTDEEDADAGRIDNLPREDAVQEELEDRWTWELDREVFSFGSSNEQTTSGVRQQLANATQAVVVPVRRWRASAHHSHKKNMGVLSWTLCGRKATPDDVNTFDRASSADDEERDPQDITKASTWRFELDKEALGFGREATIDGDGNNGDDREVKAVGGWSLFSGKACSEHEKHAAALPFARRLK